MEQKEKPKNALQGKPRVLWLDLLRITAIVFVLFIHAAAQNFHSLPLDSTRFYALVIYDDLCHIAVPLFVMISGAMLLDPQRHFDVRRFFSKNVFRIVAAFLFWSFVNLIYDTTRYYFEHDGFSGFSIEKMFRSFFVGKTYMWYLFMIFGLYIITPLVRCITKEMKSAKYFLLVFLILGCLVPSLVGLERFLTSRSSNGSTQCGAICAFTSPLDTPAITSWAMSFSEQGSANAPSIFFMRRRSSFPLPPFSER